MALYHSRVRTLKLDENRFTSEGLLHVARVLKYNVWLQHLTLSHTAGLASAAAPHLRAALRRNTTLLTISDTPGKHTHVCVCLFECGVRVCMLYIHTPVCSDARLPAVSGPQRSGSVQPRHAAGHAGGAGGHRAAAAHTALRPALLGPAGDASAVRAQLCVCAAGVARHRHARLPR